MSFFIRFLTNTDFEILDLFLAKHTLTSMFMRSNIRRSGINFNPHKEYSAAYIGAFDQYQLIGVIALNWNGNLFTQSPDLEILDHLLEFAVQEKPEFQIHGLLGPEDQFTRIQARLSSFPKGTFLKDTTYDLALAQLQIPAPLSQGKWQCRQATERDIELLVRWRQGYELEVFGTEPSNAKIESDLLHKIVLQEIFLLEHQGKPVSQANYNATLPDTYQIGGVWTPPEFRGHGYARGAVAGALQAAYGQGVQTGILFTSNPKAERVYTSLGFQRRISYYIALFKKPLKLGDIN